MVKNTRKKIIILLIISMLIQLLGGMSPLLAEEAGGLPPAEPAVLTEGDIKAADAEKGEENVKEERKPVGGLRPFGAAALSGEGTEITYTLGENVTGTLDTTNGTFVIFGTGAMYDYSNILVTPFDSERNEIMEVEVMSGVTTIGAYMFQGCPNLSSITMPDSVTSIGRYAFAGCTSLPSITIPDTVTSIEQRAFEACTTLTSVTITSSSTSIKMLAFWKCSQLATLYLPAAPLTDVDIIAFYDCPTDRNIILVDAAGVPLTGDAFDSALNNYRMAEGWNPDDNYWYGWHIAPVYFVNFNANGGTGDPPGQ